MRSDRTDMISPINWSHSAVTRSSDGGTKAKIAPAFDRNKFHDCHDTTSTHLVTELTITQQKEKRLLLPESKKQQYRGKYTNVNSHRYSSHSLRALLQFQYTSSNGLVAFDYVTFMVFIY